MNKYSLLAAAIFSMTVTGCASRPFIVNTSAPVKMSYSNVKLGVQKVHDGQVIVIGEPQAFRTATLLADVEQIVPVRKNGYHRASSGEPLYYINTKGNAAATYCTTRGTLTAKAPIGPVSFKSCFTDYEMDGNFDAVWGGAMVSSAMIKDTSSYTDIITVSMITDRTELASPLPYKLGTDEPIPGTKIGLLFQSKLLGGGRIRKFYQVRGENLVLSGGDVSIEKINSDERINGIEFKFSDLPEVIEFMGAKIELISLENNALQYKIIDHSFDAEATKIYSTFECANDTDKLCELQDF